MAATLLAACSGDSDDAATPTPSCPKPVPEPAASIKHNTIYLNVVNAGSKAGLAGDTSTQLEWRGFNVLETTNQDLTDNAQPKTAEIRYGPAGRQIALTVAAEIENPTLVKDERTDPTVDLLIGTQFKLKPVPPPAPSAITANIYNTTYKPGLAGDTAKLLKQRGFKIAESGNDPGGSYFPNDVVLIRHGERGEPAARRMALQFPDARLQEDRREGTDVDAILGSKFTSLVPVAKATAPPAKKPTPPKGC
ncbi:LytR C-terminal domain-containing protein [Demetria terragena]|uniref:LytR C-terminal domain-containing protein n=1 Tax=Demetria terragena TaxID=63959 RepID=UPI0014615EDF|nr:LytR C-terminal domain-containing protein [Demetria terragena]